VFPFLLFVSSKLTLRKFGETLEYWRKLWSEGKILLSDEWLIKNFQLVFKLEIVLSITEDVVDVKAFDPKSALVKSKFFG
jgi:hypothetical protein|tara:strand:+ start:2011 stop:2250 length:240 start_codon:yes stop_codon:yes gene_type:complete